MKGWARRPARPAPSYCLFVSHFRLRPKWWGHLGLPGRPEYDSNPSPLQAKDKEVGLRFRQLSDFLGQLNRPRFPQNSETCHQLSAKFGQLMKSTAHRLGAQHPFPTDRVLVGSAEKFNVHGSPVETLRIRKDGGQAAPSLSPQDPHRTTWPTEANSPASAPASRVFPAVLPDPTGSC